MKTFDLAPLWRSTIGFDRLFDLMADETGLWANEANYPPYNIERTGEDSYQIMLAVAGFTPEEINVTVHNNVLTIEGARQDKGEHHYLYQGISARPFRRQFSLADYVQVKGASWDNGLLQLDLVREVPEELRPRRIEIAAWHDKQGDKSRIGIEQRKRAA
jgi:molecular chaperone IbpA